MKISIHFLIKLCAFVVLPVFATASVHFTNNNPGYVAKVDMYTVIDNYEYGVTTFTCDHYLHLGESLHFEDGPNITHSMTSLLWIPIGSGGDGLPDEHNYYWNWEDLPNYPVGRVWDGVTIASDFPSWNWQNWPNNWSIGTVEEPADNPYAMSYMPDGDYKRYTTAERLRQMQRLQKLGQIRKISKLVARGLAVSVLLDVWLQNEITRVRDQSEVWSYVVYERVQPSTGKIYTGQATGPGDPLSVLSRRMSAPDHQWKTYAQGYDDARLNAYIGTIGRSFYGAAAVWGREQQVMDYNGGAISDRGGENVPGYGGRTRASNKIRSVAKDNDVGYPLWLTSNNAFGNVWEYTGNEDTKVFNVALQPDKPIVFGPGSVTPFFFPN